MAGGPPRPWALLVIGILSTGREARTEFPDCFRFFFLFLHPISNGALAVRSAFSRSRVANCTSAWYVQDGMGSNTELVNVVYLDNSRLELYHSLLDKRPNAVTYRLRCVRPPPRALGSHHCGLKVSPWHCPILASVP